MYAIRSYYAPFRGIHLFAMQDQTEMQVIATGESCCAGLANGLAYGHGIPDLDVD